MNALPPSSPAAPARTAPADTLAELPPLPQYSLPVVATAFAAGILLTTRPGRDVTRGVLRAGLLLVKPALLVGGLLKLRELSSRPSLPPHSPTNLPPL